MLVIISWLILCSAKVNCKQEGKTALAIKHGIHDYSEPIPIKANSFIDLVKKSKIFVDNTLFIRDLLKLDFSLPLQISCPRKWGRSINLDMLKTFLQLQVDNHGNILPRETTTNYKLFVNGEITLDDGTLQNLTTPLRIAKYKNVMGKYLGRYPVIFVTFNDVIGDSYDMVKQKIAEALSRAFKQHEYMIEVLRQQVETATGVFRSVENTQLEQFLDYFHNRADVEVTFGLNLLYKVLRDYFQKDVFVLMDDYDTPIQSFLEMNHFPIEELQQTIELLDQLTSNIFQENPYKETGIIMGTFQIDHVDWKNYNHFYMTDERNYMRQYFGFSQSLVNALFVKCDITEKQQQKARQWYDGYECTPLRENFYNPSSLVYFLNEKEIADYWVENWEKEYILNVLNIQPSFRESVMILLSKQKLQVFPQTKMNTTRYFTLRKLARYSADQPNMGGIYEYLVGKGYLKMFYKSGTAILPNYEVVSVMSKYMVIHQKRLYQIKEKQLQQAAAVFYDFVGTGTTTNIELENSLSIVYQNSIQMAHNREEKLHAIFDCVTLRMQLLAQFELDVYYSSVKRADYVIVDQRNLRGFIIELSNCDNSADAALRSAYRYQDIFTQFPDLRCAVIVGMNLMTNETVQIKTLLV